MPITVLCHSCSKKYRLKDELEGKKFRCKGCEEVLTVSGASGAKSAATQERRRASSRRKTSSDGGQRPKRRKRKQAVSADRYSDDLFGDVLDRFDGNYGEDIPDEDNPYRAPTHQAATRKRGRKSLPLTLTQKLFAFEGRINRNEYWTISIAMNLLFRGIMFVLELVSESLNAPVIAMLGVFVFFIPSIWISLALQIKRWHDRDKSGAWCLINCIPIFGWLWTFIECGCLAGTPGDNSYGSEPK